MDEIGKIRVFTEEELKQMTYRALQQLAKSMALPSNVKKVYLIQLIHAKTNKSLAEVESIVQMVKWERQQMATNNSNRKKTKKKRVQTHAIDMSTNNLNRSPPIDLTPKRALQSSPELPNLRRTLIKFQQNQLETKSDRILRSYNTKTYKRPNYSLINNSMFGVVKAAETGEGLKEAQFSIVSREGRYPRLNVTARCVVKKFRPSLLRTPMKRESLLAPNPLQPLQCTSLALPAKRKRPLSGMYSICAPEKPLKADFEVIQSIGFRRTDGTISKINAVVQKPTPTYNLEAFDTPNTESSYRNVEVTIQDIINSNIDAQTFTNPIVPEYTISNSNVYNNYANYGLTDVMPNQNASFEEDSSANSFSVYYHKKIRAEQVRTKRPISITVPKNVANEQSLPKIHDVFSKFANARDLTQPLYVQVSEESERILNYPTFAVPQTSMLEGVYNFKHQFVTNQPLLQVVTTSNTKCVFSTPTIATSQVQQSITMPASDAYQFSSFEQPSQYPPFGYANDDMTRMYDLMSFAEQELTLRRYHEALSTSNSSLDRSQDLDSATIPEMVEDALEIISQDGDYMERIGMDVRMQCILCSNWAGPKFVLEYHLRQVHSDQIVKQNKNEWNVTYKLGSLVNQEVWLSHVSERNSALLILSVKYEDPDCFMASITTLSPESKIGTITLYNKVTGEPFTWQGEIPELPSNMPHENGSNCLRIELSKLELLPNSANLKLHNRSLVLNSPSKVVVGQPELNDIHIIVFIKVEDA